MYRIMTRQRLGVFVLLCAILVSTACGNGRNGAKTANSDNTSNTTFNTANTTANRSTTNAAQPPNSGDWPSQQLLAQLYDQILPSVVDIEVTATATGAETGALPFGGQQPPGQIQGEGTGWVFDDQGHIVTNNHVVENAIEITVNFADGSWVPGKVVATDPQADLAVIQVTPPEGMTLRALPVATADALDVGYWVLAFGTPFGLEGTMTLGIVSALGRGFPVGTATSGATYTLPDVIQTDAAINPGNSGGPLLNLNGEVVGVNFAINSASGSNSGVGFAIPVSVVQRIVPALISQGSYAYPYLGISGGSVSPQLAEAQAIPANIFGVWVSGVTANGPAATAGLQEGDIVTAIDDQPMRSFDDLVSYLFNNTTPGQEVTLTFVRNGNEQTAKATIQERPAQQQIASQDQSDTTLAIGEATTIATQMVLNSGLLDSVESSSATLENNNGRAIWVVVLTGNSKTATVSVDAATGEIVGVDIQ